MGHCGSSNNHITHPGAIAQFSPFGATPICLVPNLTLSLT